MEYRIIVKSNLKLTITLLIAITSYLLTSCASVSNPEGGDKDEIKPKLISLSPPNASVNYKSQVITLTFDEPIILNSINQELIITPTVRDGFKAETKGKKVILTFNKPLAPITTYFLSFRAGIKDITEGNIPDSCELAFSTGPVIDSNTINGTLLDPILDKPIDDAVVALYPNQDSVNILTQNPQYICRTNREGKFRFRNLPDARFKLYAYPDQNKDLKYTNKSELLGYRTAPVSSSLDTSYTLFAVNQDLDTLRLFDVEASLNKTTLNFNRGIETLQITELSKPQTFAIFSTGKQVILSWPAIKHDSLLASIIATDSLGNKLYTKATLRFTKVRPATEKMVPTYTFVQQRNAKITPVEGIILALTDSLKTVNKDKFKLLLDADTLTYVDKSLNISNHGRILTIKPAKTAKSRLRLIIVPNAVLTLHDSTNHMADTLDYQMANESEFGIIHINTTAKPPFVIQLLDAADKVIRTVQNKLKYDFTWLPPSSYRVRIIYDTNKNGRWDAGNAIMGILPEDIIYYKEKILLKQNWEIEDITLP